MLCNRSSERKLIGKAPFVLRKGSELESGYHEEVPDFMREITEMVAFQKWIELKNKQCRVFFCYFSFEEKEK